MPSEAELAAAEARSKCYFNLGLMGPQMFENNDIVGCIKEMTARDGLRFRMTLRGEYAFEVYFPDARPTDDIFDGELAAKVSILSHSVDAELNASEEPTEETGDGSLEEILEDTLDKTSAGASWSGDCIFTLDRLTADRRTSLDDPSRKLPTGKFRMKGELTCPNDLQPDGDNNAMPFELTNFTVDTSTIDQADPKGPGHWNVCGTQMSWRGADEHDFRDGRCGGGFVGGVGGQAMFGALLESYFVTISYDVDATEGQTAKRQRLGFDSLWKNLLAGCRRHL